MPLNYKTDEKGTYVQYGYAGKKYYYKTDKGLQRAIKRAEKKKKVIKDCVKKNCRTPAQIKEDKEKMAYLRSLRK